MTLNLIAINKFRLSDVLFSGNDTVEIRLCIVKIALMQEGYTLQVNSQTNTWRGMAFVGICPFISGEWTPLSDWLL